MGEQLSTKTGKQSDAKKHARTRHTEEQAPPAGKVPGAFGKERPEELRSGTERNLDRSGGENEPTGEQMESE